jgi:hypothetical protein
MLLLWDNVEVTVPIQKFGDLRGSLEEVSRKLISFGQLVVLR